MYTSAVSSGNFLEHTGLCCYRSFEVIACNVFCGCSLNELNCLHELFLNCYKSLPRQAGELCCRFPPGQSCLQRGFLRVVTSHCWSAECGWADRPCPQHLRMGGEGIYVPQGCFWVLIMLVRNNIHLLTETLESKLDGLCLRKPWFLTPSLLLPSTRNPFAVQEKLFLFEGL